MAAVRAASARLAAFNLLAPRDPAARPGRDIAFGSDPRQKLDVYTPERAANPAPVVVFFYGGSWSSGRRQDYAFVGRALAARGFVAVIADYRIYPQVRYPAFLEDGAAAVRWTRDHVAGYGGDPGRISLAGHSAGAYNAMMLALGPMFLPQAGVDRRTIRAVAGLSGPYDFLPLRAASTRNAFGEAPDLSDTQPINHAGPASPPAFLAHGAKDRLVYPRNAIKLGAVLERAGARAEVKVYADLSHVGAVLALSKLFRGKAPVLDDMTRFLTAHSLPLASASPLHRPSGSADGRPEDKLHGGGDR